MIILLGLSITIVTLYIKRVSILKAYSSFFVIDNATKGADAILILSGADITRGIKAIELYKEGYAKEILITTVRTSIPPYPHIVKTRRQMAQEIFTYEQITLSSIPSLKGGATSTFDEAYDVATYLKNSASNHLKRLIIVTDGYHTRRAKVAFNKIFKKMGITTTIEFAPIVSKGWYESWYKSEWGIFNLLLREPIALLYYLLNDSNSKLYVNE